jgi:hypothetical protein
MAIKSFIKLAPAYGTTAEALKKRDGLGVIGILFDIQPSSRDDKSLVNLRS